MAIVWFTGEPAAGKTTVSQALQSVLANQQVEQSVALIESEQVRKETGNWDFSAQGREMHLRYLAYAAARLSFFCDYVLCASVSPAQESRQKARWIVDRHSGLFLEVYLTCDAATFETRRSTREQFQHEAVAYEAPTKPSLTLDTGKLDPMACAQRIFELL